MHVWIIQVFLFVRPISIMEKKSYLEIMNLKTNTATTFTITTINTNSSSNNNNIFNVARNKGTDTISSINGHVNFCKEFSDCTHKLHFVAVLTFMLCFCSIALIL